MFCLIDITLAELGKKKKKPRENSNPLDGHVDFNVIMRLELIRLPDFLNCFEAVYAGVFMPHTWHFTNKLNSKKQQGIIERWE